MRDDETDVSRSPSTRVYLARELPCLQCRRAFVFEGAEQRFFRSKGYADPIRCPACRQRHPPPDVRPTR